jgi:putative FmdB family regulatory protein
MPKYAYFCEECQSNFEASHSLTKTLKICNICGTLDSITRVPSTVFISKKHAHFEGKSKPGELLKSAIEETKLEVSQERQRLKKRMYKNDD